MCPLLNSRGVLTSMSLTSLLAMHFLNSDFYATSTLVFEARDLNKFIK